MPDNGWRTLNFDASRLQASMAKDALELKVQKLELTMDRSANTTLENCPKGDRWATIDEGDDGMPETEQHSYTELDSKPKGWWSSLLGGNNHTKEPHQESSLSLDRNRPGEFLLPPRLAADEKSTLKRSNSARSPQSPLPSRFGSPRWNPAIVQSSPAICIASRGSSVTDLGSESRTSLDSPPNSVLSHAALHVFRNNGTHSLSGATLFGDSDGELPVLFSARPTSASSNDSLPGSSTQAQHKTAAVVAPKPATVKANVPSETGPKKLPSIKELNDVEDKERNARHREVVDLQSGTRHLPAEFQSRFRVGELLGDGAFGFVMTARSVMTGNEVAVKFILREKVAADLWTVDQLLGRLPLEVQILSKLHHPNIIRYITHYADVDRFILITELHGTQWHSSNPELNPVRNPGLLKETPTSPSDPACKAECSPLHRLTPEQEKKIKRRFPCDLFQCIDAHSRLKDSICRHIFAQIALAVHYLHSMGYVHRDLKDENVVVDADYNIKLIDFGSAGRIPTRREDYFTYSKFNGTMHFASPEICRRQPYRGPEAEIWSLGVLLFIIVFGESPFAEKEDILKGEFKFSRPDFDSKCGDLIKKMLTYDERHRIRIEEVVEHEWIRADVARLRAQYAAMDLN